MKIVITIEVPEGSQVSLDSGRRWETGDPGEYVAPPDEIVPFPSDVISLPDDVRPFRTAATGPTPGVCPIHRSPWRVVPAGVSKKTGQPYAAFAVCRERDCEQKP